MQYSCNGCTAFSFYMLELNKIYLLDCIEGIRQLDDKSIDCVVTSPPYNKHNQTGENTNMKYDKYSDDISEEEYQAGQIELFNELHRVLKDDGHIFYNHKNRYELGNLISPLYWLSKTDYNIREEIIWNRQLTANTRGWRFWTVDERIYWLQKKSLKQQEIKNTVASMTNIWTISPKNNKESGHPCAYPEEIVRRCLLALDGENLTILDPYMGSGTTAKVAKELGHNYIGFDISENYVKLANEALENCNVEDFLI